jgi:hypothetical protein
VLDSAYVHLAKISFAMALLLVSVACKSQNRAEQPEVPSGWEATGEAFDFVVVVDVDGADSSESLTVMDVGGTAVTQSFSEINPVEIVGPYVLLIATPFGWLHQFDSLARSLASRGVTVVIAMMKTNNGIEGLLNGLPPTQGQVSSNLLETSQTLETELKDLLGRDASLSAVFAFGENANVAGLIGESKRVVVLDALDPANGSIALFSRGDLFSILATDETEVQAIALDKGIGTGLLDTGVGVTAISDSCSLEPPLSKLAMKSGLLDGQSLAFVGTICSKDGEATVKASRRIIEELLLVPCEDLAEIDGLELSNVERIAGCSR